MIMRNNERYKLFKKGKHWCRMALVLATVLCGAATVTTHADADNASNGNAASAQPVRLAISNSTAANSNSDQEAVQQAGNGQASAGPAAAVDNGLASDGADHAAPAGQATTTYTLAASNNALKPQAANGWVGDSYYQNGQKVTGTTATIGNATYSFDDQGSLQRNHFMTRDGKVYYFGQDGREYQDRFYQNWGNMYYFGRDGARYTDQFYSNWGNMYYFGDGGVRWDNRFMTRWGHTIISVVMVPVGIIAL